MYHKASTYSLVRLHCLFKSSHCVLPRLRHVLSLLSPCTVSHADSRSQPQHLRTVSHADSRSQPNSWDCLHISSRVQVHRPSLTQRQQQQPYYFYFAPAFNTPARAPHPIFGFALLPLGEPAAAIFNILPLARGEPGPGAWQPLILQPRQVSLARGTSPGSHSLRRRGQQQPMRALPLRLQLLLFCMLPGSPELAASNSCGQGSSCTQPRTGTTSSSVPTPGRRQTITSCSGCSDSR